MNLDRVHTGLTSNLAQQDAKALRVVFRVGYQAVMPVNHQQTDAAKRFPAGVIRGALS